MVLLKNKSLKPLMVVLSGAFILFAVCCKKKEIKNPEKVSEESFNKQELLVNLSDNIILPCYTDFKKSLDSLSYSYNVFKTSGAVEDYKILKQKFHVSYLKYQRISLFGFGPGEDAGVRVNFNVFPCDTTQIKTNVNSGSYNLGSASNVDAKGFPALEYLLFGYNKSEADVAQKFIFEVNLRKYTDDLLTDMKVKTDLVISGWNTYRSTFINSLGTDVGSSIGFVINQLNYELDYLKNSKIATPLGLRSGGTPLPDNCEAYYSDNSIEYAIETLNTLENVYSGKSFSNENGIGFDDYLDHLKITHLDGSLNAAINSQFSIARNKLKAISDPLSQKVLTDASAVNAAYRELVKLLVLLKTDMPSNLGVVITYQDGDGD
jgi:predicted lipoprotein